MRNRVNRGLPVVSIYLFTKVTFHVKVHMYISTHRVYLFKTCLQAEMANEKKINLEKLQFVQFN